jgi:hypothetical protein
VSAVVRVAGAGDIAALDEWVGGGLGEHQLPAG